MSIEETLAVVPVSDVERAHAWYSRFFDRPADNRPMETVAEWNTTASGWVQVFLDAERAGQGLLNFAVHDLDDHVAGLAQRGIAAGPTQLANKGVSLSVVSDPDGNTITLIGGFRPVY